MPAVTPCAFSPDRVGGEVCFRCGRPKAHEAHAHREHRWWPAWARPDGNVWVCCVVCGVILRADEANRDRPCRGPATTLLRGGES